MTDSTLPHPQTNMQYPVNDFLLGETVNGDAITTDMTGHYNPHALITGKDNAQRTSLIRNILIHATAHDKVWDIYGIDLHKEEFPPYSLHFKQLATTFPEALQLLENLEAEMQRRFDLFEDNNLNNIFHYNATQPTRNLKQILLLVEDLSAVDGSEESRSLIGSLSHLARIGNKVGITVVLSMNIQNVEDNHKSYNEYLCGEVRNNLSQRILSGKSSQALANYTLDGDKPINTELVALQYYGHQGGRMSEQFIPYEHPLGEPFDTPINTVNQYSNTYSNIEPRTPKTTQPKWKKLAVLGVLMAVVVSTATSVMMHLTHKRS